MFKADSTGRLTHVFNKQVRWNGDWYRYDRNGKMVKGWWKVNSHHWQRFHSKTGKRRHGDCVVNGKRYYFDKSTGQQLANISYKTYYYRKGDGLGLQVNSSEYNKLILDELNNRRNYRYPLWWAAPINTTAIQVVALTYRIALSSPTSRRECIHRD